MVKAMCVVFIVVIAGILQGHSLGQSIQLVSVSTTEEQANFHAAAFEGGYSADGKLVLLSSQATNLVIPDVNGTMYDLFIRDVAASTTTYGNVNSQGEQANTAPTQFGRISANGRYVVFGTAASNMPGAGGGIQQAYLHDRVTGETELISVSTAGQPANGASGAGCVTPDGRFVTFSSFGTNVVNQPYRAPQGFIRDRLTSETTLVTINSQGQPVESLPNSGPGAVYMSNDGRFVAFSNLYNDLMPNGQVTWRKIYLHDRQTGQTTLVSVPYDGLPLNGDCGSVPIISGDGRFVLFRSTASNLVPNDTNGVQDVFVRDVAAGVTYCVSVSSTGEQANAACSNTISMSPNGRFCAFASAATNLDPNDNNNFIDGFVHDLWTGTTEKVTYNWQGEGINADASISGVSLDGRVVLIGSLGTNVIQQPVNGLFATYLRERGKLGDVNRDGVVNVIDLLAIINAWGSCPAPPDPPALPIPCDADVNSDGSVNVADLLLIINNWG